jgi:hypothetical protein
MGLKLLPMPNDYLNIDDETVTVIASTYQTDTTGVLVVLRNKPGLYYAVVEIDLYNENEYFESSYSKKFPNIIPAVEFYRDQTGCY